MKAKHNDGSILLHEAAWEDNKGFAYLLVEHDTDAMTKNEDGSPPSYSAVQAPGKSVEHILVKNCVGAAAGRGLVDSVALDGAVAKCGSRTLTGRARCGYDGQGQAWVHYVASGVANGEHLYRTLPP